MLLSINIPDDKNKVIEYIKGLPDKRYHVDIKLDRKQRTLPQNRLYWMYLTCISDETGSDKDTLHEYFRNRFLQPKRVPVLDDEIEIRESTAKLNTAQMKDYIDHIIAFASADLGITLPDPQSKHWADFYAKYEK